MRARHLVLVVLATIAISVHTATTQLFGTGYNVYGLLSTNNMFGYISTPVKSDALDNVPCTVVDIFAPSGSRGAFYKCSNGDFYARGGNYYGQLGTGSTSDISGTPLKVLALPTNIVDVKGSSGHSIFLTSNGNVYTVGRNSLGQLGDGTQTDRSTPYLVSSLPSNVVKVDGSTSNTLVLTSDGVVYGMGDNGYLQMTSAAGQLKSTPYILPGQPSNIVSMTSGNYVSLFLTASGRLYGVGLNTYITQVAGPVGGFKGSITEISSAFQGKTIASIASSTNGNSLALATDGTLFAFGYGNYGSLGTGSASDSQTPVIINNMGGLAGKTPMSIFVGYNAAGVVVGTNEVYMMGHNVWGECGVGSLTNILVPTRVLALDSFITMSKVINSEGETYFFGTGPDPTTTVPPTTTTTTTAPPTTTTTTPAPTSCNQFDLNKYGAPQPVVTAARDASGKGVVINVSMLRQTSDNSATPIFHTIDTKSAGSNVCRNADNNIQTSAGVAWTKATTMGCTDTYTLTQTLDQIVAAAGDNNWVATLANDGRSITYSLKIYATFSVNTAEGCYYVGYTTVVSFRTQLSIASTSSDFTVVDGTAKFSMTGLRITSTGAFEVSGKVYPLVPSSSLSAITLGKRLATNVGEFDSRLPFTTAPSTDCNYANTYCPITFTAAAASVTTMGSDVSGWYDTTMNLVEGANTKAIVLSYQVSYIIPTDPTVVDSNTITTENKLYTSSDLSTERSASYQTSSDSLYVKNYITATSPAIPANYRLRMTQGYLCCVNFAGSIPAYNPTGNTPTLGCAATKAQNSDLIERVDLGTEGSSINGVSNFVSDSGSKSYSFKVNLNSAFSTNAHSSALRCEVLLLSKLESSGARRESASNLGATYVSTIPLFVEQSNVISSASVTSVFTASIIAVVALLL